MNFCNNCGSKITDQSPYCPSCGSRLSENPSTVFPPADIFSQQVDRAPQQIIYNVEQDNNVAPKKKNSNNNLNLILIVIIAVVLIVGAAVGTYFIVSNNSESTSQHDNKDKNKDSEYEKDTDEEDADDEDIDFEDEDSYGDYSYSEDYYTYDHISIKLPEDFKIIESSGTPVAVHSDYPARTDNITFNKSGADSIDNYTQDTFDTYYENLFKAFEGSNGFEKTTIDGYDTILYSYNMSINGVDQSGVQVMIFGDTFTDFITFTSVSGDFDDAFADAADSITID